MKEQLKIAIAEGANKYAKEKGLSNNDFAKATGVNQGYISTIFRKKFTDDVSGMSSPIGDTHFYKIAAFAGIEVKKEYWEIVKTRQYKEMLAILLDAKKYPKAFMILNDTGLGKSKAVDIFCNNIPQNTYRITVGDSYLLEDLVNELCFKVGVDINAPNGRIQVYSLKLRIEMLADKLTDIKNKGGEPVIIFDEAENFKPKVHKCIKEIYDAIITHCSIVLIGTDQILESMLNLRSKNRTAVPQLYRRFKAGIRVITPLNKDIDFKEFFDLYNIDRDFQKLLCHHCDNYGELRDFLEPVLRYAGENDKPFNENLFRMYHKLPRLQTSITHVKR